MAVRTTVALVQRLLAANYGPLPDGTMPDLFQFIQSASPVVDTVVSQAAQQFRVVPNTVQQELIERWLAAYFYCHADPLKSSKGTEGASASYVTSTTLDGEQERYKRGAIEQDPSGMLNALLNRKYAQSVWLGKRPSAQVPYDQRN